MQSTSNFLKSYVHSKEPKTVEEIVEEYKQTGEDSCIAGVYFLLIGQIKCIFQRYPLIEEDKISYALEVMLKCMDTYDGSAKFITYFTTCLNRELFRAVKSENYQKRVIYKHCVPIEVENADGEEGTWELPDLTDLYDEVEVMMVIEQVSLSEVEKEVLKLLVRQYSYKEISEELGVSQTKVFMIRKNLKKYFSK